MPSNSTVSTTTKTESVSKADFDQMAALVETQQRQIDGLQQGYLAVVDKMIELANEIVRLERHNMIGVNEIIVPRNWREMPKGK